MLEWPLIVQLFRTQLKVRYESRTQDKEASAHRLHFRTWWLSDNETGAGAFLGTKKLRSQGHLGRDIRHI